ncbi:MAG TPA: glycosyltransferase [Nocardioides sp.]|uniref:glycosyltransferase n=1 Tax=Nocardioides sp. TaxID=35761 RepID=UPI002E34B611|nr:glycosyltransferase [Nocardioides sp.]HEX5087655.1 glycosyltransferase [Nocardioides sp.]
MRVLFSSTSGLGHVIPMLQLATAFRDAGHEVLFATAAQATPLVKEAGIDAVAAGAHGAEEKALRAEVLGPAEALPGAERPPFVFPRMFGSALTPRMVEDLLPLAREWQPDLLVHEHAELAAPLVGALCSVPSVTHSFGTAVPVGILDDTRERLGGLWRAHGLDALPYAGCFRNGYLDICPASVQATPVGHIAEVHPLRPVTASASPRPAEPLVYVTLGTVHNRPGLLREVVAGVAGLGVPTLVAVGPGVDPASLGDQPRHVQVAAWVDQAEVLTRCTAVVSHGGSGTFLGALAQGVPQLCLPQAADQFRNAEGGLRAGAVVVLRPEESTATTVRGAVERVLSDDTLRRGTEKVASEIAVMPSPAAVAGALADRFGPT